MEAGGVEFVGSREGIIPGPITLMFCSLTPIGECI